MVTAEPIADLGTFTYRISWRKEDPNLADGHSIRKDSTDIVVLGFVRQLNQRCRQVVGKRVRIGLGKKCPNIRIIEKGLVLRQILSLPPTKHGYWLSSRMSIFILHVKLNEWIAFSKDLL
ncbi:hypothetical protein EH32_00415 [Erythrobacter litoralis]|uniref:Uncharacterized protein n=1 Tax=Erythrobacter litoralis TaxID=39960 RepID=A0A074MK55_9SPHN|nr:hypothetical protein EH32_00415 [Erythrobacter litoralis]